MKFLQLIFLNTEKRQAFIKKSIYLQKHLFAWESKIHSVAASRKNYSLEAIPFDRENLIHLNILKQIFSTKEFSQVNNSYNVNPQSNTLFTLPWKWKKYLRI